MAYYKMIHNLAKSTFRWQLLADNHEIIAHGETHPSASKAVRALRGLEAAAVEAEEYDIIFEVEDE